MKLKNILELEGLSFQRKGLDYRPIEYRGGFWVAITDNQTTRDLFKAEIEHLEGLAKTLKLKRWAFGYWRDGGGIWLDLSLHIQAKKLALAIAKLHGQKAIYDIKNKISIYL